jgi:hypothetical protein
MGFFAVAHLASRHGITVSLGTPPDGGSSADIYLPAPLMLAEVRLPAWMGPPGGAVRSAVSASAGPPDEDPLFSAPRFAAGPESAPEHQRERLPARDR